DRSQTVAAPDSASIVSPGPFDSIPEVSGDLDISRFFREEPSPARDEARFDDPPAAEPSGSDRNATNFDEAIKRAQAIKVAARAEREARLRESRRPITPPLRMQPEEEPAPQERDEPPLRARISTRDLDVDPAIDERDVAANEHPSSV